MANKKYNLQHEVVFAEHEDPLLWEGLHRLLKSWGFFQHSNEYPMYPSDDEDSH